MKRSFLRMTIGVRINFINLIAVIGMVLVMLMASHFIEEGLMNCKAKQTQSLVETAKSVVESLEKKARAGEISLQDAQQAAITTVGAMRYDNGQYFWINNMDGTMLMHPTSPKLIGTSLLHLQDAKGAHVFADMIDVVKKSGQGDYQYYWPPEGEKPRLKISHIAGVPGWQWVIGSGVYVDDVMDEVWSLEKRLGIIVGGILFIAFIVASLIGRSIGKPILSLTSTMKRLAEGDLGVVVGMDNRGDEIGDMARAVSVFQNNALEVKRLRTEQEEKERNAVLQKKQEMARMADEFEQSVGSIVGIVAAAATQMQASAKNLAEMADQGSQQSTNVAAATEQASASVQTVASAAEELSASIGDINRQVEDSARISREAVDEVAKTNATVATLSQAATQIGDVVKLIQDIAAQTHLLALNATIEAARAGESGKGFAVVANEVKNLANQTGSATEEIAKKVVTVQTVSGEAVKAIREIGQTIERINGITSSISHAIQQQNTATQEISSNVQQVSAGTAEVSSNIVRVSESSSESRAAAEEVLSSANELSSQAGHLRSEIIAYVNKVRQG